MNIRLPKIMQVIPPDWQERLEPYFQEMRRHDDASTYTLSGHPDYLDDDYKHSCGALVAEIDNLFDSAAAFDEFLKQELVHKAAKKGYGDSISPNWESLDESLSRNETAAILSRKYNDHYKRISNAIDILPPCQQLTVPQSPSPSI